ncbi:diaminopimelate decarboxylase [Sciscionella sediminilitoris]|uniref:diaminopimelate decarboxylase n=1 Tax=Sciscionella sediminilitoris TaxID=1445613 RepID=UPI0004DF084B|nr:diaminopimelate decarboxylase [Sciscionella sp. SE31]
MRAHPAGPRHADVLAPGDTAGPQPSTLDTLDELPALVWPRGSSRGERGSVAFAGVEVADLVEEYGTPLFVVDEEDFRSRCREYAQAFGSATSVHYAAKAFLSVKVARWVADEGLSLDVCSGGELAIALRAGFPVERIALHGNNKTEQELAEAVTAGVGTIVLDSYLEIARLDQIAREHGVVQPVMVRVTVGVEAHTHEFIATAHEDQKFGFSLSAGGAEEAVRRVLNCANLRLIGLHSHIGSQIFDTAGFEVAAHRVIDLLSRINEEHGADRLADLSTVDLGGGLGIAYTEGDDPMPVDTLAEGLHRIVAKECEQAGLAVPTIAVEPGRAIAGPGTVTLYRVGTVKPIELDAGLVRTYVSVDGGMSDNIRTALYDSVYDCRLVSRRAEADSALCRIVGKHCESGDVVVRDAWLPADIAPGDLIAVAATGAYCYSMASNYNRVPRPAVVAVRDGSVQPLLRRETTEDLLRLEA